MFMIDDLYERIAELREELWFRKDMEELIKDKILHSSISIGECETIFYYLNMFDNKQEFAPEYRKTQEELFRVLEVI